VISKARFASEHMTGKHCRLLLNAIMCTSTLNAPIGILSACGFASRSIAQETFFCRARLLHDFGAEHDTLVRLQAALILCSVVLDHRVDQDFGFWLHEAVRLANKLRLCKK